MKKALKAVIAVLLILAAVFSFSACKSNELQLDSEYVYSGISFKKAEGLTIDDLSSFIPMGRSIGSVKEFENFLIENINDYNIFRHTQNGTERIYLKPAITSIRITENYLSSSSNAYSVWLKSDVSEEVCYGCERKEDYFSVLDFDKKIAEIYFSDGALHYELELNEKFAVVYDYNTK